ncbi:hypothetical protein O988_01689, partial [Pseudogymnoascus sp. VKM F-3808]
SEYTTSRHNTFSTVSTDRTASTATSFFNFSRQPTAGSVATAATSVATITSSSRAPSFGSQNSDSGHSVTSDRPTTTPLEDLTRKMKFLKITFPDAQEASRFHTAYKTGRSKKLSTLGLGSSTSRIENRDNGFEEDSQHEVREPTRRGFHMQLGPGDSLNMAFPALA